MCRTVDRQAESVNRGNENSFWKSCAKAGRNSGGSDKLFKSAPYPRHILWLIPRAIQDPFHLLDLKLHRKPGRVFSPCRDSAIYRPTCVKKRHGQKISTKARKWHGARVELCPIIGAILDQNSDTWRSAENLPERRKAPAGDGPRLSGVVFLSRIVIEMSVAPELVSRRRNCSKSENWAHSGFSRFVQASWTVPTRSSAGGSVAIFNMLGRPSS